VAAHHDAGPTGPRGKFQVTRRPAVRLWEIPYFAPLRLRTDLYCVEWGVKLPMENCSSYATD